MIISVIIPTCYRNDLLVKCLDLIAPGVQTLSADSYEVIVTDDSKENMARELIQTQYKWATWIAGPKRGPAANRNAGAKIASGDWLVFIDDDCLPDKDILINYQAAFATYSGQEAFEGAIIPDDWALLKKDMSECPVNTEGNCFWSANICIKASLFSRINGFNEDYLIAAHEDQQIKMDIENVTGIPTTFLKDCIVVHPVRFTSMFKQLKKIPSQSKNFCIYALKNKKVLEYPNPANFGVKQFVFRSRILFQSIKARKLKTSMVSLAWLIYGVPLNIIIYSKLVKTGKQ